MQLCRSDDDEADENQEERDVCWSEIQVWDSTTGEVTACLHKRGPREYEEDYEADEDFYCSWSQRQPQFSWMPNSTICCFLPDEDEVSVRTASGLVLGSTEASFHPGDEDWGYHDLTNGVCGSPCGAFIAGQSRQSFVILTVPDCCTHLELELSYSTLQHVIWSPDSASVLCYVGGHEKFALCSLAGRCWVEVRNTMLRQPSVRVLAWGPQGLLCKAGDAPVLLDPLSAAVEYLDSELSQAGSLSYSPDFYWLAYITRTGLYIVRTKTGQIVASWTPPYRPHARRWASSQGSSLEWATSHALTCRLRDCFYLFRFE